MRYSDANVVGTGRTPIDCYFSEGPAARDWHFHRQGKFGHASWFQARESDGTIIVAALSQGENILLVQGRGDEILTFEIHGQPTKIIQAHLEIASGAFALFREDIRDKTSPNFNGEIGRLAGRYRYANFDDFVARSRAKNAVPSEAQALPVRVPDTATGMARDRAAVIRL